MGIQNYITIRYWKTRVHVFKQNCCICLILTATNRDNISIDFNYQAGSIATSLILTHSYHTHTILTCPDTFSDPYSLFNITPMHDPLIIIKIYKIHDINKTIIQPFESRHRTLHKNHVWMNLIVFCTICFDYYTHLISISELCLIVW